MKFRRNVNLNKGKKPLKKRYKIIIGAFVIILLANSCSSSDVEQTQDSQVTEIETVNETKTEKEEVKPSISKEFLSQKVNFDITEVNLENRILTIKAKVEDNLSEDLIMTSNSSNFIDLSKVLKEFDFTKEFDKLKFECIGDTVDNYGNESTGMWLSFLMESSDIEKIQYDNLPTEDIIKHSNVLMIPDLREGLKYDGSWAFLK